jgi:hypothetical protein
MPESFTSPLQIQPSTLEQLRRFAAGGYLYAILDSYNAPPVSGKVQELGSEKAVCLFISQADNQYWHCPPYLISVDESTLDWTLQALGDLPWGAFVFSKSGLETLRTHLRRFLIMQLLDGERWFFRFYDPRLLRGYLENCRAAEVELFFGPVRAFGVIEPGGQKVTLFHIESKRLASPDSQRFLNSQHLVPQPQAASGERSAVAEFEDTMARFVRNAFPARCQALGEAAVREIIRYGYKRAASYQFTRESDRSHFVELLFLLGQNFDQNPSLSWVQRILHDPAITDPSVRMAHLWQAASEVVAQNTFVGGK